ncbi:MAG: outer membrane lipid asymmetry maintenance protein MlaD [Pseudomonadota bacterium]
MEKRSSHLSVGIFLILGTCALFYLTLTLGNNEVLSSDHYALEARFVSASGLRRGAYVEVGGVEVGKVGQIELDYETYEAKVTLHLDKSLQLQEDAIASIRTSGIIGDKFVKISPGGSDRLLKPGEEIIETESSINLEELISKYIFESK